MYMENVFKLAIQKQMDNLQAVIDEYVEDCASSKELLKASDELNDLVHLFDKYSNEIDVNINAQLNTEK